MKNFLVKTLIIAAAVVLAAKILPGVAVARFSTAILAGLVLSVLNFTVKPILIILTLPVTIVTLGLFLFIINALIILLVGKLVAGFHVDSIWSALLFSILLSFFTYLLEVIFEPDYKKK